jgi:hypothetical protein
MNKTDEEFIKEYIEYVKKHQLKDGYINDIVNNDETTNPTKKEAIPND